MNFNSTLHYYDKETSPKKIASATEPYLTYIKGLWRKLDIAAPSPPTETHSKPCPYYQYKSWARAAVVHLNFRAGSTFPVPVCTVLHGHWVNKAYNQQD